MSTKYRNPVTGEFTAAFQAYWDEVARHALNFDCNQVERALDAGLSPRDCAEQCNAAYLELPTEPHGDPLDHDYSMNF